MGDTAVVDFPIALLEIVPGSAFVGEGGDVDHAWSLCLRVLIQQGGSLEAGHWNLKEREEDR